MSGTERSHAMLLDELAALDPPQRHEVAAALRTVAETFAGCQTVGTPLTHSGCWSASSIRVNDVDALLVLPNEGLRMPSKQRWVVPATDPPARENPAHHRQQ